MFKRLLLVMAGSAGALYLLRIMGLFRPIYYWIYGGFLHDKIAHFVVGATYAVLLAWVFQPWALRLLRLEIPAGALLMLGLATFDEVMQIPMRGRDADPFDLLASVMGIAFGVLVWNVWQQLRLRWVVAHA
ncbi:MAG: VanZ family protein [Anaerolineales bacterium]